MNIDVVTDELVQAYFRAIQETATASKDMPMARGSISKQEYQDAFKAVRERTSSSPDSGLHYTLWKALAKEDDLADWLSVMMSLPFMYGFVNER